MRPVWNRRDACSGHCSGRQYGADRGHHPVCHSAVAVCARRAFPAGQLFWTYPGASGDDDRYTLDELLEAVVSQSGGLIKEEQIAPSCCDHPMCGFHGDFIVMPGDKLMPLTNYSGKPRQNRRAKAAAAVRIRGEEPRICRTPLGTARFGRDVLLWRKSAGKRKLLLRCQCRCVSVGESTARTRKLLLWRNSARTRILLLWRRVG